MMIHTSHTTLYSDEQSEPKRSQFEHAVLKAYGIVAVHECSVADLRASQSKWKESRSSFTLKNEAATSKTRKDDMMNDIPTENPLEMGQPWQIARAAAEVRTRKYEEDVLKAYGLFL